jgi:hypothetical protein
MNRFLILTLFALLFLINCSPDETPPECRENEECHGWAYAFVNKDTDQNLVGYDRSINPDSVIFISDEGDTMNIKPNYRAFADWWEFDFRYQDELERCDLHNTDSTYTLRYYIYLSQFDSDTLDIRIAPCRNFDAIFFNGNPNIDPPTELIGDLNPAGLSSFFLRK